MSEKLLTVTELAAVVADPQLGDKLDLVHRQLRHWSASGVFLPAGRTFTGSGSPRQYRRHSAYLAAVLVRIAAFGLAIGPIKALAETLERALAESAEARRLWDAALTGAETRIDLGFRFVSQGDPGEVYQATLFIVARDDKEDGPSQPRVWALPTLWLDISDLFTRVRRRLGGA